MGKEQLGDMPEFVKQREEVGAQVVEKIKERNQIRDDYRAQEKEYNEYLYKQRQEKKERQWKEQQEREAAFALERKQRQAEKLDDQPYVAEITLVEQTILFCKGLVQSKGKEQKSEEKKFLAEIQELKRNRPKVTQVSGMEANIKKQNDGVPVKEKLDKIYAELTAAREAKKKVQEKLTELNESRKEQLGDMPEFVKQREEVGAQVV